MKHLDHLGTIARADVDHIIMKEKTYKGSWKKRGGTGAFHMLARKWDRIEGIITSAKSIEKYNIFDYIFIQPEGKDGSLLAEIRDLRRYLLLVEAEMVARSVVHLDQPEVEKYTGKNTPDSELIVGWQFNKASSKPGTPEDGGNHYRDIDEEV